MHLQLLRNATLKLRYAGRTILIDLYFAPRHSLPSYTGRSPNPMVELPISPQDILEGVELLIVSHLHSDHFDGVARGLLPKHLPLICRPGDETTIREAGFEDVRPLEEPMAWEGLELTRREGSHGLGSVRDKMGPVMGFSLTTQGEPHLYWAGDTVLYPPVEETIVRSGPEVIVVHACGALWDGELIVMDADQALEVCRMAPRATVIATHMEALDHATVSRQDLRLAAKLGGVPASRLLIPADGQTLTLS